MSARRGEPSSAHRAAPSLPPSSRCVHLNTKGACRVLIARIIERFPKRGICEHENTLGAHVLTPEFDA